MINSTDIPSLTLDIVESSKSISLRSSGQMLIGLLKILYQKSQIILQELEEFIQSFASTPRKSQKYTKNTKLTQLITLNPKKALLAIDDSYSIGSYIASTRGSIEIGRNLADVGSITLNELSYTPKTERSIVELDDAGSVMQIDSPFIEYQDPDLFEIETPKLTTNRQTPMSKAKAVRNKVRAKVDKKTLMKVRKDEREGLVKEHLRLDTWQMGLSHSELFDKPLITLPAELTEMFKELKSETYEFGNDDLNNFTPNQGLAESGMKIDFDMQSMGNDANQYINDEIIYENTNKEEEYERLKERSKELLSSVQKKKGKVKFTSICSKDRFDAGRKFYDIMMLASKGSVNVFQPGYLEEIFIKFNKV